MLRKKKLKSPFSTSTTCMTWQDDDLLVMGSTMNNDTTMMNRNGYGFNTLSVDASNPVVAALQVKVILPGQIGLPSADLSSIGSCSFR